MTLASDEVPVLGLGREATQAWITAALTVAGLLRERRIAAQRLAWSDGRDAARLHDIQERVANPPVRAMSDAELDAWERVDRETRRVAGPTGSVVVSVGQVGDRWGVVAEGAAIDGEPTDKTHVSCVDEDTAKWLADQLLAAGPAGVEKLQRFAALAAERADVARAGVREPEEQRLARTAAAVREVWDDWLGEVVTESPAFGALAWRLHEMEELGYAIKDVLCRIDEARLRDSEVRNPAALAEWFVENMVEKELKSHRVINLDTEEGLDGPAQHPDSTSLDREQPAAATVHDRGDAAGEAAARRAVVEPVLAEAMPAEVFEAVQRSRGYEATLALLHDLHERGAKAEPLLHKLPLEKIAAAHDPGGYLAAVLRRRAEQNQPQRTGINRTAMAELVHEGLPRKVADRVVDCRAWPTLAHRLADWNGQGLPLVDMLTKLPAGPIYRAEKPAAYAASLLAKAAATARQEQHPDRRRHSTDQQQTRHGAAERTRRPAADDAGGSSPDTGAVDAQLRWTEDLDPTDAIDRVALEATQGMGSTARIARVDQQLQGPAHGDQEPREAARPTDKTRDRQEILVDAAHPGPAGESAAAERRAALAEQRGALTAAAARAEVTLTRDSEAADAPTRPAGRAAREPAAPPSRRVLPQPEPGRSR
jgi:hypothetical protein